MIFVFLYCKSNTQNAQKHAKTIKRIYRAISQTYFIPKYIKKDCNKVQSLKE